MKVCFILYLIAFCLLKSQTVIVDFEQNVKNSKSTVLPFQQKYKLISNNYESIFIFIDKSSNYNWETVNKKSDNSNLEYYSDNDIYITPNKRDFVFYKNISQDTLIFMKNILNKYLIIGEKLNKMDWQLVEKDTIFLEYPCKIAKTSFRKKNWTVFYTDEIPFIDGPWKFYGLPGLILYAKTDDEIFEFKAKAIQITNQNLVLLNPYLNEEIISWDEFKLKNYEKMKSVLNQLSQGEDGGEAKLTENNWIEYLGYEELNEE